MKNNLITAFVRCPDPTLPRCRPRDVALGVGASQAEFTGGSDYEVIGLSIHHPGPACQLKTQFHLSVRKHSRGVRRVPHNPIELNVDRPIAGHKIIGATWLWASWCGGEKDELRARVSMLGKSRSHHIADLPVCNRHTGPLRADLGPDPILGPRRDPFGPSKSSPVFGGPAVSYHRP